MEKETLIFLKCHVVSDGKASHRIFSECYDGHLLLSVVNERLTKIMGELKAENGGSPAEIMDFKVFYTPTT